MRTDVSNWPTASQSKLGRWCSAIHAAPTSRSASARLAADLPTTTSSAPEPLCASTHQSGDAEASGCQTWTASFSAPLRSSHTIPCGRRRYWFAILSASVSTGFRLMMPSQSQRANGFCSRALGPLSLGELDALSDLELFEDGALNHARMEEQIAAGFGLDEPESLVGQPLDASFGHRIATPNGRSLIE